MAKKKGEPTLLTGLPPGAQQHIKENKISVKRYQYRIKKKKYSMTPQMLNLKEGFDILENFMVVRHYVCQKNKIPFHLLELLWFLYPKNYFTLDDYYLMPKQFNYNRISSLEKLGLVKMASRKKSRKTSLFCLTSKAQMLVVEFYMFLGGEKKMPVTYDPHKNPEATAIDKIRFNLIKKINAQEPSESKKAFY